MNSQLGLALPFILYLIALVGIGFYTFRTTRTMEGFVLGGRKLHPWVAGMSVIFSGSSGWMYFGAVGLAYTLGPAVFYMLLGNLVALTLTLFIVPKRLRNYSGLLGAITYPSFFVKRVRDNTNLILVITSVSLIAFMGAYIGAQYSSAVKALVPMFGWTPLTALLITAAVVTLYCLLGGFSAVCLTDYIQGWVIIGGTILADIVLIARAGGWSALLSKLAAISPGLMSVSMGKTGAALLGFGLYYFGTAISILGRPHDTIRYFAIRSSKDVREMAVFAQLALLVSYWTCFIIGYAGRAFFPALKDPETVFPLILTTLFNPWFAGIMLTALMGLIMSTVDSQLLSVASTLSKDVFGGLIDKKASEKKLVWVARVSVVVVSLLGMLIAYRSNQAIVWLTLLASGGLAATFGPSLVLSLYWKRLTKWGVISGMLSGFAAVVYWYYSGFRTRVHEAVVGWAVGLAVAYVVSKLTQAPDKEEIDREFGEIVKEIGEVDAPQAAVGGDEN